jgi:hypothetical protein
MVDPRAGIYQTLSAPNPNPPLRDSEIGYIELVSSPDPRVGPMIFALEHTRVRLGRFSTAGTYATSSDVFVAVSDDATAISPMNTMFEYIHDRFHAFDTRSTHGTCVNGEQIYKRRALVPGDIIDIGGILDGDGVRRGHARVVFLGHRPPEGRPIRRAPPRTRYRWESPRRTVGIDIDSATGTARATLDFLGPEWRKAAVVAVQDVVPSPALPAGTVDGDHVLYDAREPLTYLPPRWNVELPRACAIVADLCDALAGQLVVLGPFDRELVWVRPRGRALLLGAGLSRVAFRYDEGLRGAVMMSRHFRTSAEELMHGRAAATTDVYYAAYLLVELVTGHEPFPVHDRLAYLTAVRSGRAELPAGFPALSRAFDPDPAARPSFGELAALLRARLA